MAQTIGERVRVVREQIASKDKKLSQEAFARLLGTTRSVIANIEYERVEPSGSILKLICATFGVDYHWLTTGEGEMLHVSDDVVADRIEELLEGENETAKALFRAFAAFDESDWKTVQKFIDELKKDGAE